MMCRGGPFYHPLQYENIRSHAVERINIINSRPQAPSLSRQHFNGNNGNGKFIINHFV